MVEQGSVVSGHSRTSSVTDDMDMYSCQVPGPSREQEVGEAVQLEDRAQRNLNNSGLAVSLTGRFF